MILNSNKVKQYNNVYAELFINKKHIYSGMMKRHIYKKKKCFMLSSYILFPEIDSEKTITDFKLLERRTFKKCIFRKKQNGKIEKKLFHIKKEFFKPIDIYINEYQTKIAKKEILVKKKRIKQTEIVSEKFKIEYPIFIPSIRKDGTKFDIHILDTFFFDSDFNIEIENKMFKSFFFKVDIKSFIDKIKSDKVYKKTILDFINNVLYFEYCFFKKSKMTKILQIVNKKRKSL